MTNTYLFDSFQDQQQKDEITRLTKNVDSHSKALCEHFFNNGLLHSKKLLDVGCGTGAMLDMFASLLPDKEFVGIDSSQEILTHAKEIENPNIQLIRGEASSLPFEDNSFDFVYTRLVLMHNPNPSKIIQEMIRVCKPNGIIMSVEIDDETMIFYPYAQEFSHLIRANIEYSLNKGMDRTMGRKLYSIYKSVGIENVKVIVQTSDYEGPFEEVPFPLRLAMGSNEGQHLVEMGLINESQRRDYVNKIKLFSTDEDRFYSGSFMYCVGTK